MTNERLTPGTGVLSLKGEQADRIVTRIAGGTRVPKVPAPVEDREPVADALEDGVLDGVNDLYVAKGKKVEHVARPRCARAGR